MIGLKILIMNSKRNGNGAYLRKPATGLLVVVIALHLVCAGCFVTAGRKHRPVEKDSTVVADVKQLIVHDTLVRTDSVRVRDTIVGIGGNEIITTMHDTVWRQGPMRLMIRNGVVDCKSDSLTLVIRNLMDTRQAESATRLRSYSDSSDLHSMVTVEQQSRHPFLQRAGRSILDVLACLGAVVVCRFLILSLLKKQIV
jgi:hypothetical protein